MQSWTQREKLNQIYDVSPENAGLSANWNVNPGSQTNKEPQGAIKTDVHMDHAVSAMFLNKAERIASSRHGGIYEVYGNVDALYASLSRDTNAFVQGSGYPQGQNFRAIIKVTRTHATSWNEWLRFRVREAKMHAAVYTKLGGVARCLFVPDLYFAGVDYSTGMYFSVMQRPQGKLVSVARLIKDNKFNMHAYRAVEAAVSSIWRIGAMLTDTSEGNVLISSKGHATIIDFDSSIVLPNGIRERMWIQIDNVWKSHRLDSCHRILNSKEADLVKLFNFVTREQSDMPMLKRLTINVYGRKSWFPDVNMLTLLFQTAHAYKQQRGGKSSGSGWISPVKKFFKPLRKDPEFKIPEIKIRRVQALPDEVKQVWRTRKHASGRSHGSHASHSSNALSNMLRVPSRRIVSRTTNNNGENIRSLPIPSAPITPNGIPMPPRTSASTAFGVPVMSRNVANLVSTASPGVFSRRVNVNNTTNTNTANNTANKKYTYNGEPTSEEFGKFKALPKSRQAILVEKETERIQKLDMFTTFKAKLIGEKVKGTYALNRAIQAKFPDVGWSYMVPANKTAWRREHRDAVAVDMLRDVVRKVLERNQPYIKSRNDMINAGLTQSFGWLNWGAAKVGLA